MYAHPIRIAPNQYNFVDPATGAYWKTFPADGSKAALYVANLDAKTVTALAAANPTANQGYGGLPRDAVPAAVATTPPIDQSAGNPLVGQDPMPEPPPPTTPAATPAPAQPPAPPEIPGTPDARAFTEQGGAGGAFDMDKFLQQEGKDYGDVLRRHGMSEDYVKKAVEDHKQAILKLHGRK
jgi:hypothetical protein